MALGVDGSAEHHKEGRAPGQAQRAVAATGTSTGIGRVTVRMFAEQGLRAGCIAQVLDRAGRIDVLVTNEGSCAKRALPNSC